MRTGPSQPSRDEKQLLEKLRQGDAQVFRTIMKKYHEKLLSLSTQICRDPHDAEEAIQDVYITLMEKAHQFEERSSFSTWLYRIAVNRALMKVRSEKGYRKNRVPVDSLSHCLALDSLNSYEQARSPEESLLQKELSEHIERAFEGISHRYQHAFYLRDIQGMKTKETSEALNISVAATKSRLYRSRHILRERLERIYCERPCGAD